MWRSAGGRWRSAGGTWRGLQPDTPPAPPFDDPVQMVSAKAGFIAAVSGTHAGSVKVGYIVEAE